MMFSTLPVPTRTYDHTHYYTPSISSPLSSSPLRRSLSPRDANIPTSTRVPSKPIMSPSPIPTKISCASPIISSSSSKGSAYSKRVTKPNPLLQGRGKDGTETRRKLFLKKVREDSEDRRWAARGGDDEMMRSIWIAEQRRREEGRRKEALGLDAAVEEDEYMSLDELMVDEVALMEEAELEALASMDAEAEVHSFDGQQDVPLEDEMDSWQVSMEGQDQAQSVDQTRSETLYGSDDDEYDHIFMNVIQEEQRIASQTQQPQDGDHDLMDMS